VQRSQRQVDRAGGVEVLTPAELDNGRGCSWNSRTISTAGPAAPAMATPLWRSAAKTFSIVRWLIRLPEVARRSPAMTTPSA